MNAGDPQLDRLVSAHLEGRLTPEEEVLLHQRMVQDAEARRRFVSMVDLHAMLVGDSALAGGILAAEDAHRVTPRKRPGWKRAWMPAAAAAALVMLVAGWWQWARPQVVLLRGAGQQFSAEQTLPASGDLVGRSAVLTAGLVELHFRKADATVVIEAPARFRIEDAKTLRMESGRIAAHVRDGRQGLRVLTPHTDVLDLGTRFAVDVEPGQRSEVHVFEGKVEATNTTGMAKTPAMPLVANEALRFADARHPETREMRSGTFVQPEEMRALMNGLASGQRARSEAALTALRRDPALIALLDFEEPALPAGTYRVTQGRWPGSRAPEFVNVGDHMKLAIGGRQAWPQLTLAAWVRLDRMGAPYQSLYHTDGWDADNPGQVHWMINKDTTMRLALKSTTLAPGSEERYGNPDSRTPVLAERGRWVHLAVVYDAGARTVRFYLNGAFDKETRLSAAHPALLGPAQIGNWSNQDRKLSGRVDEMLFLGRAMNDDEVSALHAAGNPYR